MAKQDLIFKGGQTISPESVLIRFTYPGGLTMAEFRRVGVTNFFRTTWDGRNLYFSDKTKNFYSL